MAHDKVVGEEHWRDARGRPRGGVTWGPGIEIRWQNGLPVDGKQTGCYVEDVIDAALGRLAFHQAGEHASIHNSAAIDALRMARGHLDARTEGREEAGVDGTYEHEHLVDRSRS